MNAKNLMVQHKKKGAVKLGSLSHNELCRTVVELMNTNRELQMTLKQGWEEYQKALKDAPHIHNEECKGVCEKF